MGEQFRYIRQCTVGLPFAIRTFSACFFTPNVFLNMLQFEK